MAKTLRRLLRLAAVAGVAAAALSYYRQYRDFHKDLDEEFKSFEDESEDPDEDRRAQTVSRSYVSLNASKDEFTVAAKDTFEAAKGMASSAREMLLDVGHIIAENMRDGGAIAGNTAKMAAAKVKSAVQEKADQLKTSEHIHPEDLAEAAAASIDSAADEALARAADVKENARDQAEALKQQAEAGIKEQASEAGKLAENVKQKAEAAEKRVEKATHIVEEG
jgi:hypothetical protein